MNISYLKKYQPTFYKDFFIDEEYITLLNTLQKMNNLNILFIGELCGTITIIYRWSDHDGPRRTWCCSWHRNFGRTIP